MRSSYANKKSDSMNICILRHARYPECARVRKEVLALSEAGHSVDIICLREKGQPAREKDNNVRIFRIPLSHKRGHLFRYIYEYTA